MAAHGDTGLYPFDPEGINPLNLIKGEQQPLQVPSEDDYYFIIPFAAPFFVDSLKVYNPFTNQPYEYGIDYLVGHWFVEAMNSTGRPIAGSIRFMRLNITGKIGLDYRTIGGQWGYNRTQILEELARKQNNPLTRAWGAIGPLPYSFPPTEHSQSIDKLVGSEQIKESLDKIAAAIEAAAQGTTDDHLHDYNNPHRVTAAQVGLGLVPNFAMATDQEHIAATRNDLFTNPRGVYLSITEHALVPLNLHIANKNNPHGVDAAQVGLGNVPNYPAATPEQAIDTTNNSTLLTPYTASLLFGAISDVGRLDQIQEILQTHISNQNNPHRVTAQQLNVYTIPQIDQMLQDIAGGGSPTFGGLTPAEWRESLPSFDNIKYMADGYDTVYNQTQATFDLINPNSPITPEIVQQEVLAKITSAAGDYASYVVFNPLWKGLVVKGPNDSAFPDYLIHANRRWASRPNARYWVVDNHMYSSGSSALPVPAAWGPSGTTKVGEFVVTGTKIYMVEIISENNNMITYGNLYRTKAGGTVETLDIGALGFVSIYGANEVNAAGEMVIVTTGSTFDPAASQNYAFGNTSFVNAMTPIFADIKANQYVIQEAVISENYLTIYQSNPNIGSRTQVWVITRFGSDITLTLLPTLEVVNGKGQTVTIPNDNITSISGSYKHTVFVTSEGKLYTLGSNEFGQAEVSMSNEPYLYAAAGNGFTVTVDRKSNVMFWGNSPSNDLIWGNRGTSIPN